MARKRTTTRRRAPVRRRRRSSRGSFGGTKLMSMGTVRLAAFSTGGFIAASTLPDRFGIAQLQTGYGRVAGKALVGVVGGMVLTKVVGKSNAAAFTTGALTAAGVELYGQIQARQGISGMGGDPGTLALGSVEGTPLLGMDGLGELIDDDGEELVGMGAFDDDDDDFV